MPLTISPHIASITINAHTYTHSNWENDTPGTISGLANDFVTTITALGATTGSLTKSISGNTTLSGSDLLNLTYKFTGTLSANANITFPAGVRSAAIINATSGGYALLIGYAAGTKATIPASGSGHVYGDSTNFGLVDGIAAASGGLS